jgi:molybdate transport system substrate-binding protein
MDTKLPLQIITSGAFAAALQELAPVYTAKTGEKVDLHFGSSHGAAHDSIPTRLSQGQTFDAFVLAREALDKFAAKGSLAQGLGWDLVESNIAVAVRVEDPAPDISTLEAFKKTMLSFEKVALSASASGIYLSTEVFPKLGIAEQMSKTAFTVFSERVGHVIARGEADIGCQQASEIMPIKTVKIIGFLPPEIQRPFYFSAGIGSQCVAEPNRLERTKNFLRFLASPAADEIVRRTGLEPLHPAI